MHITEAYVPESQVTLTVSIAHSEKVGSVPLQLTLETPAM